LISETIFFQPHFELLKTCNVVCPHLQQKRLSAEISSGLVLLLQALFTSATMTIMVEVTAVAKLSAAQRRSVGGPNGGAVRIVDITGRF